MTAAYSTTAQGYLSMMVEPVMDKSAGFLTNRPLRLRLMAGLPASYGQRGCTGSESALLTPAQPLRFFYPGQPLDNPAPGC